MPPFTGVGVVAWVLNAPDAAALTVVVGALTVVAVLVFVSVGLDSFESPHAVSMTGAATSAPAVLRADLVPTLPSERPGGNAPARFVTHDRSPTHRKAPAHFTDRLIGSCVTLTGADHPATTR